MSNGNTPEEEPDFSFLGGADGKPTEGSDSPSFEFNVSDQLQEEFDGNALDGVEGTESPSFDSLEATDPSTMFAGMGEPEPVSGIPVDGESESPDSAATAPSAGDSPDEAAEPDSTSFEFGDNIPQPQNADSPTVTTTDGTESEETVSNSASNHTTTEVPSAASETVKSPTKAAETDKVAAADRASKPAGPQVETNDDSAGQVSQKTFSIVAGYAAAITILLLLLLLTGRISISGQHPLESLPDIEPLKTDEFQDYKREVDGKQVDVTLPPLHDLRLGESRRFGDILLKPLRVTREVVSAVNANRPGSKAEDRSQGPVLKLWFELSNVSAESSFAPWDLGLMCHRYPELTNDPSTRANSWLKAEGKDEPTRILNFLHNPESEYSLVGQNGGRILAPGESIESFVACSEEIQFVKESDVRSYRWRIQIRKGVNADSGHGVTTLIDILFAPDDVGKADNA